MPQLWGGNFLDISDIYQDFRIVGVVFVRAIHWSVVPAEGPTVFFVCNIMLLNFVNMAESKVENVRENIKMNLRNIFNKCFTTLL